MMRTTASTAPVAQAPALAGAPVALRHGQQTASQSRRPWLVPGLLVLFSIVPAFGGVARLNDLATRAEVTADTARFFDAPWPIVIHIPAALIYSILGAFQFTPALRRRHTWHRRAGRLLLPIALIVAITGLWMTVTYRWPDHDGLGVYLERLVVGTVMLWALWQGIVALRRRQFATHGEWMIRAYALGMGAATQVLTHLPWFVLVDLHPGRLPRMIMMGSGWVINALVAEWIIRRGRGRAAGRVAPVQRPRIGELAGAA